MGEGRLVLDLPQSPGMLPSGDDSMHTQSRAGPQSLCGPRLHLIPRDAPEGGHLHMHMEPSWFPIPPRS